MMNANGANVRVIFDADLHAQEFFKIFFERHVAPFEVRREDYPAILGVHRAGGADADGFDLVELQIAFINGVLYAASDPLDDFIRAALRFGAQPGRTDAFQREIEYDGINFGPAKVKAEDIFAFVLRHNN